MTQVTDIVADLKIGTAKTSAQAEAIMLRAINAAVVATALLYRPAELKESGSLIATSALKYVSMTALSRFVTIDNIYNITGSCPVWQLELPELDVLQMPTTGNVTFYAIYGDVLHYRPQPASDETLTVYYFALPLRLANLTDTLPLDMYQDFILSFAQSVVWAAYEETEDQAMWQKVSDMTGTPWNQITQIRDILNRQVPYVNNIQAVVSKDTVAPQKT